MGDLTPARDPGPGGATCPSPPGPGGGFPPHERRQSAGARGRWAGSHPGGETGGRAQTERLPVLARLRCPHLLRTFVPCVPPPGAGALSAGLRPRRALSLGRHQASSGAKVVSAPRRAPDYLRHHGGSLGGLELGVPGLQGSEPAPGACWGLGVAGRGHYHSLGTGGQAGGWGAEGSGGCAGGVLLDGPHEAGFQTKPGLEGCGAALLCPVGSWGHRAEGPCNPMSVALLTAPCPPPELPSA